MASVQWGVLGCSDFARRRTIPALLETPSAELVGVASRSPDKAEAFRSYFNLPVAYPCYEALLEDPRIQAVYIPLPCGLHAEWMIKTAGSGKHCLCEKPFTRDAAEALRVREAFAGRGLFVTEGLMWRHHSQHRRARRAIEKGAVGPVRLVRSAFSIQMKRRPDVRLLPELGGGCLRDIGCYPISAARFYFDDEPRSAVALGEMDPQYGVDMAVTGALEFARGRALFDCSFSLPYRADVEIVGERGTIRILKPWLPEPEGTLIVNEEAATLPPENHYVRQFESFSGCILKRMPPQFGPDDAVRQMLVIDAVLRSLQTGRAETVEPWNGTAPAS